MTAETEALRRTERKLCIWGAIWGGLLVLAGAVWLVTAADITQRPGGLAMLIAGLLTGATALWGFRQPTAAILVLATLSTLNLAINAVHFKAFHAVGSVAGPALWVSLMGAALNAGIFSIGAYRSGRLDGSLFQILVIAAVPMALLVPSAVIAVLAFDWPLLALFGMGCASAGVALGARALLKDAPVGVAWRPSALLHVPAALGLALLLGWSARQYQSMLLLAFGPSLLGAAPRPDGLSLAVQLAVLALLVPIAEEFLFRGYIQGTLTTLWGDAAGVLAAALLFTGAHLTILAWPILLVLGLMLGLARQVSGSLLPGIVFHAAYNACVLL